MTETTTRPKGTQRPEFARSTDREAPPELWRRRNDAGGSARDIIVLANRLPVVIDEQGARTSPGGLVSALTSVFGTRARWIGWPGTTAPLPDQCTVTGHRLHPVSLTDDEIDKYYNGFSNTVLWPLFHGRLQPVEFDREWWDAYLGANAQFAAAAVRHAPLGATVWVHDYHLLLTPAMIRRARPDLHIGLFLHIPFPAPQLMSVLPWREQIIDGMLGADLIGFQTADDAERFRAVAERFGSSSVAGEFTHASAPRPDGRRSEIGTFPISIDFDHWDRLGSQSCDAAALKRAELGDATLLLGVDRLDYTKGIARRIEAFGELLDEGRLSPDDCVFVQVAVPSRTDVDAYENEQLHMQFVVDSVNERHQRSDGSDVVQVIHSSLGPDELAQWYRAANIMMVTPFADGMNLVAKEFVASRSDLGGALILSEFAGSAHELAEGAFLVNPYDVESIKQAVLAATSTTPRDTSHRMGAMRAVVRANDVNHWADRFMRRLDAVSQRRSNSAARTGLSTVRATGTAQAIGGRAGSSW